MKKLLTLLGVIIIFSCQNVEENEKPDKLIPEQKMIEVLTEISLINSAKNYNKSMLEETGINPEEYLYEKYNIDSIQLAQNTKYYARNYSDFKRMYTQVKENLEEIRVEVEKKEAEQRRIRDSIFSSKNRDSLRIDSTVVEETKDSLINKYNQRKLRLQKEN